MKPRLVHLVLLLAATLTLSLHIKGNGQTVVSAVLDGKIPIVNMSIQEAVQKTISPPEWKPNDARVLERELPVSLGELPPGKYQVTSVKITENPLTKTGGMKAVDKSRVIVIYGVVNDDTKESSAVRIIESVVNGNPQTRQPGAILTVEKKIASAR